MKCVNLGFCAVLAAVVLIGCSRGPSHKLAPVSGKVTLDGNPASGVHVTFTPRAAAGQKDVGPGSAGVADSEGRFTLQTAEKNRRPGAVVGKHSVMFSIITERAPDDDSVDTKPQTMLPQRYRDGSMTFDVPAGGTDKADFEIDSKAQSPAPGGRVDTGS